MKILNTLAALALVTATSAYADQKIPGAFDNNESSFSVHTSSGYTNLTCNDGLSVPVTKIVSCTKEFLLPRTNTVLVTPPQAGATHVDMRVKAGSGKPQTVRYTYNSTTGRSGDIALWGANGILGLGVNDISFGIIAVDANGKSYDKFGKGDFSVTVSPGPSHSCLAGTGFSEIMSDCDNNADTTTVCSDYFATNNNCL